ncbi:MAG: tRNA 4-thiouridine(8) synthase ThiI [Candidatus Hermodarchaeota archaeon]
MKYRKKSKILGIGLISGGLDSLIASLLLKLQNIEVIGLNFKSPFCICDKALKNSECGLNLYYEKLGINLFFVQKEDDYLEIIRIPEFGYGKNLNPCIDCRIYILKKAKKFTEEINADFVFTGEVLNQRPKSQNLKALNLIEKESGLEGKLLRPLSALLLKPTKMEEHGLIDRFRLLGIKGRSRKIQLELARKYDLLKEYYACGGCLLTDKQFSRRMSDYFKFNSNLTMRDINFLKYGRHFRYNNSKIIIGRNEFENNMLRQIKNPNDLIMEAKDVPGPITIIQGKFDEDSINFAAEITLRYSDAKENNGSIIYGNDSKILDKILVVKKADEKYLRSFML